MTKAAEKEKVDEAAKAKETKEVKETKETTKETSKETKETKGTKETSKDPAKELKTAEEPKEAVVERPGFGEEMEGVGIQILADDKAKTKTKALFDIASNLKDNSTTVVCPFTEECALEAGTGQVLSLKMVLTRPQPPAGAKARTVTVKELTANAPKLLPVPGGPKDKKGPTNMVSCVVTGVTGATAPKQKGMLTKLLGKGKKDEVFPLGIPPGGTVELGLAVWVLVGCNVNLPLEVEVEVGESEEGRGGSSFTIGHLLRLESESTLSKELGPVAPFEAPVRRPRLRFERRAVKGAVLPGGRQERNQLDKKVHLPMFPVPMAVRVLLASRFSVPTDKGHSDELIAEMRQCAELMEASLDEETYVPKFSLFLHLNELEQQGFLESYTMESGVFLKEKPEPVGVGLETKKVYELTVPGLAEGRPKIVVGDPIYVTVLRSKRRYEGLVRALTSPHTISIGMSKQFESEVTVDVDQCKVEFGMCRVPVRMQQRALTAVEPILHSLFPHQAPPSSAKLPKLDFLNQKVAKNPEQRTAVSNIVGGGHHPAPYIIFGPPGTGKTVTLVEAIAQLVNSAPKVRVLACATSNAAVDLLANRLLHYLPAAAMMRLNACSRSLFSMDQETQVFEISPVNQTKEHFIIPPAEVMEDKKVILSTLCNAGQLATAGLGKDWLDAVFVDEAGQGCEPETLVALGGVAGPQTRIVLAGDPHQLGPVLYSRRAADKGLSTPMMERLMRDFPCYAKEGQELDKSLDASAAAYNPRLITKLVRNYRSHPELLKVPSALFYADELIPSAEMAKESLSHWDGLPCPGVPLIVHGVVGAEMREARSPSYFNPLEMCVVKSYVDQLLAAPDHGVKDKHIGIIAPYHQQVRKTKTMLSRELGKYGNMCVGSVEEFQGAERRVLILSTVRSSPDCLAELEAEERSEGGVGSRPKGRLGGIGFLANPKRFNTAITRAKALLIVVGNPYVLQRDHYWRAILHYALEKGAYRGVGFRLSALSPHNSPASRTASTSSPNASPNKDKDRSKAAKPAKH